jgi:hypothetical protein
MLRDYKYRAQKKGTHREAFPPSHCKVGVRLGGGGTRAMLCSRPIRPCPTERAPPHGTLSPATTPPPAAA